LDLVIEYPRKGFQLCRSFRITGHVDAGTDWPRRHRAGPKIAIREMSPDDTPESVPGLFHIYVMPTMESKCSRGSGLQL
jgi:hypothetical protein